MPTWICPDCNAWFKDEGFKYRHAGSRSCRKGKFIRDQFLAHNSPPTSPPPISELAQSPPSDVADPASPRPVILADN